MGCSNNLPTTAFFHNLVDETAAEYQLTDFELMDNAVAAEIKNPAIPSLILQYSGRHYTAFLYSISTGRPLILNEDMYYIEAFARETTE